MSCYATRCAVEHPFREILLNRGARKRKVTENRAQCIGTAYGGAMEKFQSRNPG